MPEYDYEKLKKEAEQYIKFEKDKKNSLLREAGKALKSIKPPPPKN